MSARDERGSASIWAILVIAGAFTVLLGLVVDGGRVIDDRVAASRAAAQAARVGADSLSSASVRDGHDAINVEAAKRTRQKLSPRRRDDRRRQRLRRHRHGDRHRDAPRRRSSASSASPPSRSRSPNPPKPSPRRTSHDRDPPNRDPAPRAELPPSSSSALVVGVPALLVGTVGNPIPDQWTWTSPLTTGALLGLLACVAWVFWAQLVVCVVVETIAEIRLATGHSADWLARVPGTFGGNRRSPARSSRRSSPSA